MEPIFNRQGRVVSWIRGRELFNLQGQSIGFINNNAVFDLRANYKVLLQMDFSEIEMEMR